MKSRLLIIALACLFAGCRQKPMHVAGTTHQMVAVDASMDAIQDTAYLNYLQPIKQQLNEQLDIVIGEVKEDMFAALPESNLLNWTADALCDAAKRHYNGTVDFAVVNVGGVRCSWQKGDLTMRQVFELMPFDNRLVILTVTGKEVLELADNFASWGGQGVSKQIRMELTPKKAKSVLLHGKKIVPEAVYYIATSNYLAGGNDKLYALNKYSNIVDTYLLIRDLYIEQVKLTTEKGKQIYSPTDGRMKIVQN